jgi:hypothetical protein|tara:strand:- start:102 stop:752 length:651 start_codon:yes stop_codon:yes gene_type:complete
MSFTYGQLKTAVQDYTENDETSFVTSIPTFIRMAEERILKNVQLSLFRKNATTNFISGKKYLPCPSDFLAPFSMAFIKTNGDKEFMDFKDVSFLQTYTPDDTTTGEPRYYAIFDVDNFIVAPTPNSAYASELHYYYRPQSLTALTDSGTTWLSENAEMALLYGSLIEAYIYMKGEQDVLGMYAGRFQEAITGIKMLGEAKETTDQYRTGMVIRTKQ